MTLPALSDATEILLQRPLSQVQGVSQVWINGQRRPALRIQASPAKLAAYGLSDHYREIFELTRLDEAITIYDDEASALVGAAT